MKLTIKAVGAAKPREKPYKLADGNGMFLLVNPNGSKYWRLKYYFNGKEKLLALGVYPEVSLTEARERTQQARRMLRDGLDPIQERRSLEAIESGNYVPSFKTVADDYIKARSGQWSERYANDARSIMKRDVFPFIGNKSVNNITPQEVLNLLRTIEQRGAVIQARKVRNRISEVFNYAIVIGHAKTNPAERLTMALQKPEHGHNPTIEPSEIPAFLDALEAYTGDFRVKAAIKLLMLTGLRTGELRGGKWSEIDFNAETWQIPAERMKMKRPHIVPLSRQAVSILQSLQDVAMSDLIFPNRLNVNKPINAGTLNNAIKLIGYGGRLTPHGLRHLLSTVLHDAGYPSNWIELTLAHADKNTIRSIYNHAQLLPQRREMLQSYADWLDSIRTDHAEPIQCHAAPICFPSPLTPGSHST
ncbi:tyrosine-type recombinase/integrase [Citrobacter freundii]|uniref:tyrosine-type recombinase/integrase n=1 Tax=Citrobacter TaxID=544 RepID=UPI0008FD29D5|nr:MULTISPECIES: tyrosine-type recombinase/integrase [Citrobacter]EJD6094099.1 tyrosine-type recombinase/integrase [Citrobacter freundii]EKS9220724.1 tyrosine-type recombinase/integrase [Citrobacter freundii]MBJ8816259.1 tyrosine-type recombinase/integrase [Citrobacter freundii]MBJ9065577.1 tyrosine-type recombinase/integrase [Citrobacter freundii]MBJ9348836.1 tyrosine-type recombinase/integrase [Citrobacter freundii]